MAGKTTPTDEETQVSTDAQEAMEAVGNGNGADEEPGFPVQEWDGEIAEFSEAMRERGHAYASYVNTSRAIPDVRDGLKPVQRRIIFGMDELNVRADRPFKKSALTVGHVMGSYHPHGDSAIYDAMVRMAQPHNGETLIEGQGNWGNLDADPAAAMRYCVVGETRIRLADGTTPRIADLVPGVAPDSDNEVAITVMGAEGQPLPASRLFHSGEHPTLRVRTDLGPELTGTANHPVLVLERDADGRPFLGWRLLADLAPGAVIAVARHTAPDDAQALSDAEQALAVLLGALVAEGFVSETRAGFSNTDESFSDAVRAAWGQIVGDKTHHSSRVLPSGKTLHELDVHDLTELRRSPLACLVGVRSADQRVPERVWRSERAFKRLFLSALYEGDGSCSLLARSSVQIALTTKSEMLARDVQLLLTEFGIIARLVPGGGEDRAWRLVISNRRDARLFAERVGFFASKRERLDAVLELLPASARCQAKDTVPFLADYIRAGKGVTWEDREWLRSNRVDGIDRFEAAGAAILERIAAPERREAARELMASGHFFARVTEVADAGVQAVYSVRVDDDTHAFCAGGFVNHNTESRLSALASAALTDLRPEVVAYRPNFSETKDEATVIPVVHPNLLTIGVSGIGWAMGCSVPTHNLAEAIDAAILVAERPEATLAQIMKRLPGPDFPGGGVLVNPDKLAACYEAGQGTVQLQGRFHLENLPGNRQAVVVTELPYQVGPSQLVEQIVKAARDGKITEITELPRDLSSKDHPVRVQIACKRGGNVQTMIHQLLQYTKLRDTVSFNMNVLVDGKPRVVSLAEILSHFVGFRLEVVTRRLEHERSVLERELHRLLALMAAVDAIDAVVKIIRGAKDDADAKDKLIGLLKYTPHGAKRKQPIDEQQANWILEMQLRRLNQLNRFNLAEEVRKKGERIDEITAILTSEHGVRDIVVAELRETKKRFGQPRRTALEGAAVAAEPGEAPAPGAGPAIVSGPATPVTLYVSRAGFAFVADRTGKPASSSPLTLGSEDALVAALEVSSTDAVIAVSAAGTAYRTQVGDPESGRRGKGRNLVGLVRGDRLATVLADRSDGASHALIVTATGQIKRVEWAMLSGAHAGGVPCMKVADGDRIVAVVPHGEADEIIISSSWGQALRVQAGKLRPVATGSAGGVAGMGLRGDDEVVYATLAAGSDFLVAHEQGFAKRVALSEYPTKGRGGAGVASASPDKPSRDPAGNVTIGLATDAQAVRLFSLRGQILTVDVASLPQAARAVVSRRVLDIGPGDGLAGVVAGA